MSHVTVNLIMLTEKAIHLLSWDIVLGNFSLLSEVLYVSYIKKLTVCHTYPFLILHHLNTFKLKSALKRRK